MISKVKDVMNIDIESIGLLSLILQDSPKDRLLILCVLARSNSTPARLTFHPNTDYPTFYGYANNRIPFYLMGKGVLSNVPREGYAKRLISAYYLSFAETLMNKNKNWDIHQKIMGVSKFITLDNRTAYKDAEVFLVFRDKALDYIKSYATSHKEELSSFLGQGLSTELFTTNTSKAEAKPVSRVTYNPKKGELDIEGKNVKFKRDSFRAKLLELLLKDDKSRKKEWSWDEVIEAIEDTKDKEATKENKNKFYPACDGLTKHIASKIGVNDLLIFTKSTVQINPKYL